MEFSYIITDKTITMIYKGEPLIVDETHSNFNKIKEAIKNKLSIDDIYELVSIKESLIDFGDGDISVNNGIIYYKGKELNNALSTRMFKLMEEGFDIKPLSLFIKNLYQNHSFRAVNETYGFLEACNLPITEDGHFLTYKKITDNYLDCYTRTIDNSIGSIVEVPRNEVDEDSDKTCSYGLHVAAYSYMKSYSGDRIVICKVNPRDVVAVPKDYNNAKMRVCRYEVIDEVSIDKKEEVKDYIIIDKTIDHFNCKKFKKLVKKESNLYGMSKKEYIYTLKNMIKKASWSNNLDLKGFRHIIEFYGFNNRSSFWRNKVLDTIDKCYPKLK